MSRSRPPFPSGWSSIPISPRNLCLANTLPVGQSFLWHRHPLPSPSSLVEEFSRAVDRPPRVVCLRQSPTHLYYTAVHQTDAAERQDEQTGVTRRWLYDYFQLDTYPDLERMYEEWRKRDPLLFGKAQVDDRAMGIRVLRQDPWECLLAFITSTNNHIPRITSLLHRLSRTFSPPLVTLEHPTGQEPTTHHLFPNPQLLPDKLESLLREMGFGYRASFIDATVRSLRQDLGDIPGDIESGLLTWRGHDVDVIRDKLLALKGVGRKVADCVMLMCLDKPQLIPIDTHVAAIAARHPSFPSKLRNKAMTKQVYEETQSWLSEAWGPLGGWCQAVMFALDLPTPVAQTKMIKTKTVVQKKQVVKRAHDENLVIVKRTRRSFRLERDGKVSMPEENFEVSSNIEVEMKRE